MDYRVLLEEELKKKLPKFQQGNDDFDQLLEAAGQYLDKLRSEIDSLKYNKDWSQSSVSQLSDYADHINLQFPQAISDEVLRVAVRDIVEIYRHKGTERTLRWIFKVIGLDINIRYAWLLNPDDLDPEFPPVINNELFIYGRESVYENGTYFDGVDIFENSYNKIPIIGEKYPNNKRITDDKVIKSPYVFLEIDASDYDDFVSTLDTTDQFLLDEIIEDYFDEIRPANVAIVVVITVPDYEDDIPYEWSKEELQLTHTESPRLDNTWMVGAETNPYRFHEHFEIIKLDQDIEYIENRERYQRIPTRTRTNIISNPSKEEIIHLRSNTFSKFDVTINTGTVSVQVSNDQRRDNISNYTWNDLAYFEESGVQSNALVGLTFLRVITSEDFDGEVNVTVDFVSPLTPIIFPNRLDTHFQRDSTALFVNSDGLLETMEPMIPRQTFNPLSNNGSRDYFGFIIETETENKLLYNEILTNSVWERFDGANVLGSIDDNAPLEERTAIFYRVFREEGSSVFSGLRQTVSDIEPSKKHTASVFAKSGTDDVMTFAIESGDSFSIIEFDTNNIEIQEVSAPAFDNRDIYFEEFDNGIYRLFFEFDSRSDEDEITLYLLANYNGTGIDNFTLFWGAQLEQNSGTSYIRNEDVRNSRKSDSLVIDQTPPELIDLDIDEQLVLLTDVIFFSTQDTVSVAELTDENDNNITLNVLDDGFSLSSNMFSSIVKSDVSKFNMKRNDIIVHYFMIVLTRVDQDNFEYSFYYNDELVGSEVGPRLTGQVTSVAGEGMNGTVYNFYLCPVETTELFETKYSELLQGYRVEPTDEDN